MRLTIHTAAGLVAGALGATIWAGLSHVSGRELGFLAWAIGLAVGLTFHFAGRGKRNLVAGALAAAVALLAIAGGKIASVMALEGPEPDAAVQAAGEDLLSLDEPELIISYLADDVVMEHLGRGVDVEWPEGVDPCFVSAEADYPPPIWREAAARWELMDLPARQGTIDRIRSESGSSGVQTETRTIWSCLRASLGPLDLLFLVLGLLTAFGVGSGRRG